MADIWAAIEAEETDLQEKLDELSTLRRLLETGVLITDFPLHSLRLFYQIRQKYERKGDEGHTGLKQMILSVLDTETGMSPKEVAEKLGANTGSIRIILRRLLNDGKVSSTEGLADKRTKLYVRKEEA